MKLFNSIENRLIDGDYKIIYKDNYLDIINYIEVLDFSDREISVKNNKSITKVVGDNLIISKMLDNELIIKGNIIKIEL